MLKSYFQFMFYDTQQSYLRQTRRRRSRSFVQGFLKLHYAYFDAGSISITDIDGSGVTVNSSANESERMFNSTSGGRGGTSLSIYNNTDSAGAATTTATDNGIIVGTGTTAVAPTDYQLATRIADGITSGALEYFPCGGTTPTNSGTSGSFTLERLFRNSSGGSITINEVGIYCIRTNVGTLDTRNFCIIRDIVSPGFAVANGEYMRVIYTITLTA